MHELCDVWRSAKTRIIVYHAWRQLQITHGFVRTSMRHLRTSMRCCAIDNFMGGCKTECVEPHNYEHFRSQPKIDYQTRKCLSKTQNYREIVLIAICLNKQTNARLETSVISGALYHGALAAPSPSPAFLVSPDRLNKPDQTNFVSYSLADTRGALKCDDTSTQLFDKNSSLTNTDVLHNLSLLTNTNVLHNLSLLTNTNVLHNLILLTNTNVLHNLILLTNTNVLHNLSLLTNTIIPGRN
ncbi:hypothetical protein FHG87_016215 [Trinorchestia longiramus]|nr:hypothetical protein FHG87_016215 [Trinorchestia longiramus]